MKYYLSILLLLVVGCGKDKQAHEPPGGETAQNEQPSGGTTQPEQQQSKKQPSVETEQEAIAALEKLGAAIEKDEDGSVVTISLRGTKITDAGLVHLKGLTNLKGITIYGGNITDAGLVHLKGLKSLNELFLANTEVTDAGLVHLQGLSKLEHLQLTNTQVSYAGAGKLKKALPNCTITPFDSERISILRKLGAEFIQDIEGNVVEINLHSRMRITNNNLKHLKRFPELQSLFLPQQINDAGLVHLKGLTNLQHLGFPDSKVTDAGLVHLMGLTKLKVLHIHGTKITDAGVKTLKKSCPKLSVGLTIENPELKVLDKETPR